MTINFTATQATLNGKPVETDKKAFALMLKRAIRK